VFRPIGVIGGGFAIPMAIVGSVVLLLILLRYVSIRLVSSDHNSIKEVSMVKTLKARTRIFFSSVVESIWATGVGIVAGHLSA
jgi:hypothetical protein